MASSAASPIFGLAFVAVLVHAAPLSAQHRVEEVVYESAEDGTLLSAVLTLPGNATPGGGIVVLSVAGTRPLVDRLVSDGYAVLAPVRRGFVDVEPLLAATYDDLAADVASALAYLGGRPEVDDGALAIVAQADDTPPALLAQAGEAAVPLVLLAPPELPGLERFRREQRSAAEAAGWSDVAVTRLDDYVAQIAEVVSSGSPPYVREYRLNSIRAVSPVQLPRSAAFPADEGQMHFFASPLWHDRLAFDPRAAFAELRAPVLVLIGSEDANTPLPEYLDAMRAHLGGAGSDDVAVCLLQGRTRHTFSVEAVASISRWLSRRLPSPAGSGAGPRPDLNRPERDPAEGC